MNDPDVIKVFQSQVRYGNELIPVKASERVCGFKLDLVSLDGPKFKTDVSAAAVDAALRSLGHASGLVTANAFQAVIAHAGDWEHPNNPLNDAGLPKYVIGDPFVWAHLACLLSIAFPDFAASLHHGMQYVDSDNVRRMANEDIVSLLVHVAVKDVVNPGRSVSLALLTKLVLFSYRLPGMRQFADRNPDCFFPGVTYREVSDILKAFLKDAVTQVSAVDLLLA